MLMAPPLRGPTPLFKGRCPTGRGDRELSPPKAVTEGVNVVENKKFAAITPSDLTSFGHLPRKGGGFIGFLIVCGGGKPPPYKIFHKKGRNYHETRF